MPRKVLKRKVCKFSNKKYFPIRYTNSEKGYTVFKERLTDQGEK